VARIAEFWLSRAKNNGLENRFGGFAENLRIEIIEKMVTGAPAAS
jgi:hypothetical protein